jgi:hypothetical protein
MINSKSKFDKVDDFLSEIRFQVSFSDMLASLESDSQRGQLFERFVQLAIAFGVCQQFPRNKFQLLQGNANNGTLSPLLDFQKLRREKISSGNSGGFSDISLKHKQTGNHVFFTSKYFKSGDKSIADFDIQKMLLLDKHFADFEIWFAVRDRNELLQISKRASESSEYLKRFVSPEKIIDLENVEEWFEELQRFLRKHFNQIFSEKNKKLKFYFH